MVDESVQDESVQAEADQAFRVQQWGSVQVVHFLVDALLDPLDVQRVDDRLQELLTTGESARVLLDLGPLEHDTAMQTAPFVKRRATADEHARAFLLARPHPRLRELLEQVRLTDMFELHETVEGAVKSQDP